MLVCSGVVGTCVTAVSVLLSVLWGLKIEVISCVYLEVYWGWRACDAARRHPRDVWGDQCPISAKCGWADGYCHPLLVLVGLSDAKFCFLVYKVFDVLNLFFLCHKKICLLSVHFPLMTKEKKSKIVIRSIESRNRLKLKTKWKWNVFVLWPNPKKNKWEGTNFGFATAEILSCMKLWEQDKSELRSKWNV